MQREDHNLGRGVEIDNGMKECGRRITDSNKYDSDSEIEMRENVEDSEADPDMNAKHPKSNRISDTTDEECDHTSDEDEKTDDDGIGKYVIRENEETAKHHSPLLPRNIRGIIVGKSGAGKSVFLTYLLLEPEMLDYDNLIVCGPSLHQPLYNIMNKGFSMNLSKGQVRAIFENHDMVKDEYGTADNLLDNYKMRCKGGINTEFIDDVDLIPDPVEFDERKKNVLVLDDVLLGPQNKIEDMYTRGRHNGIDTFYIAQNYFKIPRQTVRDRHSLIIFKNNFRRSSS